MTMNGLWVLGASDPEMTMIEVLLADGGRKYCHASIGEARVRPGTAYRADPVEGATHWVECAPVGGHPPGAVVIDHHRAGDPGFGRPPAEFMTASSLGQVLGVLGEERIAVNCSSVSGEGVYLILPGELGDDESDWPVWCLGTGFVPTELILAAAADHCLGAAYRGECPGVDPDALMLWRAESRSRFQGRPVEEVLADVAATSQALLDAPRVALMSLGDMPHTEDHDWSSSVCDGCSQDPVLVADMRREPPWPELPEAGTRLGVGYISGPLVGPDGRQKFTCSGSAEQVEAFLECWGPRHGLVDMYGDPARGFAGGYL